MYSVIQPSELFTLVPLVAVQVCIAVVVRRRLGSQLGRVKAALYWTAVLLLAAIAVSGIFLALVQEFASRFRLIRTLTFLWLLPCFPAFFLYVLYRAAAERAKAAEVSAGRRRLLQAAGWGAIASPFAVEAWGTFITRTSFQVQEIDLPIAGLHPDLAGLRILQISDVHLSQFLNEREFARVIDAANELRPQVAVMTGDLISSWGDPLDACIAQLGRMKADAPVLGCLGNHETYVQVERYTELEAAKKGITFLRHSRRDLRFGQGLLNIAGIDYQPFSLQGQYLRGTRPLLVAGAANILLSHNPDVFSEAPEQGWHAVLAGHTHGGQVTVEILRKSLNVARFFTPYVSGLYLERESACYVTRGIGTIGIPARVGAAPEITLLRLRRV